MEKSLVTKVILAASLVVFGVETNRHAIQAEEGTRLNVRSSLERRIRPTGFTSGILVLI